MLPWNRPGGIGLTGQKASKLRPWPDEFECRRRADLERQAMGRKPCNRIKSSLLYGWKNIHSATAKLANKIDVKLYPFSSHDKSCPILHFSKGEKISKQGAMQNTVESISTNKAFRHETRWTAVMEKKIIGFCDKGITMIFKQPRLDESIMKKSSILSEPNDVQPWFLFVWKNKLLMCSRKSNTSMQNKNGSWTLMFLTFIEGSTMTLELNHLYGCWSGIYLRPLYTSVKHCHMTKTTNLNLATP